MRGALWLGALVLAGCAGPQGAPGPATSAPELIAAVNATRAAQGAAPLPENPALTRAAMAHAADMAARGYVGSTAPDGSTPLRRMRAAGFEACYAAELIAAGAKDPAGVVARWQDAEKPRRRLLSPNPRAAGAGRAPGNLWVMTLARAC
jgi:uncharacterized protein YkwD